MKILFLESASSDSNPCLKVFQDLARSKDGNWQLKIIKAPQTLIAGVLFTIWASLLSASCLVLLILTSSSNNEYDDSSSWKLVSLFGLAFIGCLGFLSYQLISALVSEINSAISLARAHHCVQNWKPNFVAAAFDSSSVALSESTLVQLPLLLFMPQISTDLQLALSKVSFVSVLHDKGQKKVPLTKSLKLSEFIHPGASDFDFISKGSSSSSYEDLDHIESLILQCWKQGWRRLALRQEVTFSVDEESTVWVTCEKEGRGSFFHHSDDEKEKDLHKTKTEWLSQSELKEILLDELYPISK